SKYVRRINSSTPGLPCPVLSNKTCPLQGLVAARSAQGREERFPPPKAERRLSLRVFGRLPVTGARACTEAGVRKASREETAGGVCVGGAVGLWGFSAR